MSTRETLVRVYSERPAAEVESTTRHLLEAFNAASFDALKEIPGYQEEARRVGAAKKTLESISERNAESQDQALQCLAELVRLRSASERKVSDSPEYDVMQRLIAQTLYRKWPADDRARFDQRRAFIDRWNDVFISYTNRGLPETNNAHKKLISNVLGWPGQSEAKAANYLARVLAKCFEEFNVGSFVDYKSLRCGDELQGKIYEHCEASIGFVQLVELVTFKQPDSAGTDNWCYREYQQFSGAPPPPGKPAAPLNRCFFALVPSVVELKLDLQDVPKPYQQWFERAYEKDLHFVVSANVSELRTKVKDIARQIRAAREQHTNAMLSSWT
jgi:hypothetical protein